jgi:glycine/D-amino acid oxidase-like deaminating enzyme/nitrite reductase/ring-hydroxylating ferredoxin subunit
MPTPTPGEQGSHRGSRPPTIEASLWLEGHSGPDHPRLQHDAKTEVAVIGAGITGLSTALMLQSAGIATVVLEARSIAAGTTGNTTAKLTVLHGLQYAQLIRRVGHERAAMYAAANSAGLDWAKNAVSQHQIDCDLTKEIAYTCSTDESRSNDVANEVEAAQSLGLGVRLATNDDSVRELPMEVTSAVSLGDQVAFHPVKYCHGLANTFVALGGRIFEGTRATGISEDRGAAGPVVVATDGGRVSAGHVVMATLIPFHDAGLLFARAIASRSYALAMVPRQPLPAGMFFFLEGPRSFRHHSVLGRKVVVAEGEEHTVGKERDAASRSHAVEDWAIRDLGAEQVTNRWSAQDYMTPDSVPYVGHVPGNDRLYAACGFNKWGMTGGTAAALMISADIQGGENQWAKAFALTRFPRRALRTAISVGAETAKSLTVGRLRVDSRSPASIGAGEGAVTRIAGKRCAVHRDNDGILHAVSAICTHLGCTVGWNTAEHSWDCPCHGSRFDVDGSVLEGPATEPLHAIALEEKG